MNLFKDLLCLFFVALFTIRFSPVDAGNEVKQHGWSESGSIIASNNFIYYSDIEGIRKYNMMTEEDSLWCKNEGENGFGETIAAEFIVKNEYIIYVCNGIEESQIKKKMINDGSETVLFTQKNQETGAKIFIDEAWYPETTGIKLLAASEDKILYLSGQWDSMSAYLFDRKSKEEVLLMEAVGGLWGIDEIDSKTVFVMSGASTDVRPVLLKVINETGEEIFTTKSFVPCYYSEGKLFFRSDEEYDYDQEKWMNKKVKVCSFDLETRIEEELCFEGNYFSSHIENDLFWTMEEGNMCVFSLKNNGDDRVLLPGWGVFFVFGERDFFQYGEEWYLLDFEKKEAFLVEDFIESQWSKDYTIADNKVYYRVQGVSELRSAKLP